MPESAPSSLSRGQSWSRGQRLAHWALALCVLSAAGLALWLLSPPDWSETYVRRYYAWIGTHKLLGLAGLVFVAVLFALHARRPPRQGGPWAKRLAAALQFALIALTAGAATTGYLADAHYGGKIVIPGVVELPSPFAYDEDAGAALSSAHHVFAYALLFAIGVHVATALVHHFVLKDHTLAAMLTGRADGDSR
jgi:cytochrome b561